MNLGGYRGVIEWYRKAAVIAQKMTAADPFNLLARDDVGMVWTRIATSQTEAGEYREALESFQRAEPIMAGVMCRAGIKKDPANPSWNHILWRDQALLAAALASDGQSEAALTEAHSLLETVRHLTSRATQSYLACALTANGTVHSILAKLASDGSRVTEWRTAAGFYRGAMDAWQQFPNRTKEPCLRGHADIACLLRRHTV
jgi:hypothetical protein